MATQCPKCNTKNPDDSKYCKECASPLKRSSDVSVTKTIKTPTKGIAKGATIAGKYQILQKLGEGGMGVVYKAKDSRLDRTVALKFLSSDLIKDKEAKKRFIQEAKAAAALEHPNICTVYEVDEANGQTFIAMSYIEGQSLKDKLKNAVLSVDEAKDIAIQVAEGLKEAHDKGIVHRDIKPANIMITKKGQAKITDFGLAKLSWGVDLTKTSTIMGTVAYMSPEQAKGEEVDHRTDIWSLGAMLYEMLSGEHPFHRRQEQALIYAILSDKPTPLSLLRSDIPTHIEQVIEKALAKKASERYQDIQELIQDLKLSIIFPKAEKSIVVLPFENLSPDLEQEYFCDGMTEEIISDLSKVQVLKVISRSSAMTFKGTKKKIRDIAKDVNVQYVLEGSVRKAGNNLRITAQLIEAANDVHLWAEKYSGTLDDVFDIQEKTSHSIVDALKIELTPEENEKMGERPIDNIQAYECHLRARREMLRLTEDGLARALRDLHTALGIVGENALLYVDIGMVYFWYLETGFKSESDNLQKAEEFANKVLKLKPDSSYSNHLLGMIERFRGSALHALKHFQKALIFDPNYPDALAFLVGGYALQAGKASAAIPFSKRLLDIDPLTPLNYLFVAFVYWMEGEIDHAISLVEKVIELEPESLHPHIWRLYLLAWKKDYDKVFELIDQLVLENSSNVREKLINEWCLFFKHALKGEKKNALDSVSEYVNNYVWNDPELPWIWACHYALIDEKEEALKWLERAINRGWINYPLFAEQDPFLENIRGEPRFRKLMERVKHEWENFEV